MRMLHRLIFGPRSLKQSPPTRPSSGSSNGPSTDIDLNAYQKHSDETLEELGDKLESVLEHRFDKGADVCLNNGVLTVVVDKQNTYVINKQVPNRQIWLSSPISGPKRFDYVTGEWRDKSSQQELKKMLSEELSKLLNTKINC